MVLDLSEKYVYEIYKEGGFSKAAKKLYITQSSLSSTIKKLETKLGFSIFDRSKSPIVLTREGKIYIEYLGELIESEENMKKRVKSLSKPLYKQVSVGGMYFLSRYLFPDACREFGKDYPDVEVKLHMGDGYLFSEQIEKLDQGAIDIMIAYSFDDKRYVGIPLMEEKYVVCVRKDFPNADKLKKHALTYDEVTSGKFAYEKIISDYSLFENIEFLKINSTVIIWHDMAKFLMHCPLSPYQVYNCRNIDVIYDMMLKGLGAAITTDAVILSHGPSDDVYFFFVKTAHPSCQSYAIYKKDTPLSRSAEAFIDALVKSAKNKSK